MKSTDCNERETKRAPKNQGIYGIDNPQNPIIQHKTILFIRKILKPKQQYKESPSDSLPFMQINHRA